jgi:dienelactone hydrolase
VDLNAPVLGLYGGQDTGIPLDTVETMRHALRAANAKGKSWFIPMPDMPLTQIIGRAITKNPPKMAGNECWRGSGYTALKGLSGSQFGA